MKQIGFLLLLCMALSSCSSDDDEQVVNSDGRKLRQLTIIEVPITRATLTDNTSSLEASWDKNDNATYFNVSSFNSTTIDYGTLTASSSNSTSMFQGTVRCKTGDKVSLLYPAKNPILSGSSRGKYTISLDGQKGTLDDISNNFHYIYGVAEVTSVTESTANATIDNMQSLLAVCKFSFTDGSIPIPVKTLTINYYDNNYNFPMGYPLSAMLTPTSDVGTLDLVYPDQYDWSDTNLSVTLDNESSSGAYVALFPYSPTGYIHFNVTNSTGTYTGTAKASLKAGKYYPVTLKLSKQ